MSTTRKRGLWTSISVTADEDTSEIFKPLRGCRILNPTVGAVTFSVYEIDPVEDSGEAIHCEDIADITIAAGSSKSLGTELFACNSICLKLSSGTATLRYVAAE